MTPADRKAQRQERIAAALARLERDQPPTRCDECGKLATFLGKCDEHTIPPGLRVKKP